MTRVTSGVTSHRRKKKRLKMAKGFRGPRSKRYRLATETVNRALAYSWKHRKAKKRSFRNLWIARINAASRSHGITYNRFIEGLKKADVELDRKILAKLAVDHPNTFSELIKVSKEKLKKAK